MIYPGLGIELKKSASLQTKCTGYFDLIWLLAGRICDIIHDNPQQTDERL